MDDPPVTLRTRLCMYISHFLSAWGDRMWQFGMGLFLVELEPGSLQLVAIYGLASGIATLLLSTTIGAWVDKTPRLRAARTTLSCQNVFVAVCSVIVFVVYKYLDEIKAEWEDELLLKLCFVIIIFFGICADLSSIGTNIVVERDWVVELCRRDAEMLSSMTSTMRAIDLTTQLVAPLATGQVIYFLSLGYGAVFVAGWNVVSLFVEYNMIKIVYDQIPSLAAERSQDDEEEAEKADEKTPLMGSDPVEDKVAYTPGKAVTIDKHEHSNMTESTKDLERSFKQNKLNGGPFHESSIRIDSGAKPGGKEEKKPSKCENIFFSFIVLYKGWKVFMSYKVAFAGLGLATLYMTVLGFDNITIGFAYSQGISESVLGMLTALGSIFGIAGTFAYPAFRRCIGLKATGVTGMIMQITCLSACVISVFLPGSPFDLLHRQNSDVSNSSTTINTTNDFTTTHMDTSVSFVTSFPENITSFPENVTSFPENVTKSSEDDEPDTYLSVGFFMGGLIAARFGLWIADLTITQLFLQTVKERERGLVSGIQSSMNQLMDMLKALMVILAPYPEEFGLLTIISFTFVVSGCLLYCRFLCKNRNVPY